MFTTTQKQQRSLNFIGYSVNISMCGIAIVITFAALNIVRSIDRLSEAIKKSHPVSVASTECVAMSQDHLGKALIDYLFSIPKYRDGQFLNINALDDLDPVHYRATQNTAAEFDYDGDMGREHSEYLRDNGVGGRQLVAGTFVQIADALPVIVAPSIIPNSPITSETGVPNPVSSEADGHEK